MNDWDVKTEPIVAISVTEKGNPLPVGYVVEIGGDYYTIVSKVGKPLYLHPYASDTLEEAVLGVLRNQVSG